jgi:hypothetical protein
VTLVARQNVPGASIIRRARIELFDGLLPHLAHQPPYVANVSLTVAD